VNGREEQIPFPLGGRDDQYPSKDQKRSTTREAVNVISRSLTTRRFQGARRPGTRKATPDLGGMALGVTDLVVDTRHVTFNPQASPTTEWVAEGPSGRDAVSERVDDFGDVYTLEGGTHVVIRNSAGVERATLVIPVADTSMRCRALEIDSSQRTVYVAVSDGGSQARAKVWAYIDQPYVGWTALWSFEPGFYVEKLALRGDTLHASCNDLTTGRAYVVSYASLSTTPLEIWRQEVPAPANTIAVDETSGKIAVGTGFNPDRGKDPRYPGTGQILSRTFSSYWFDQLSSFSTRSWCAFDPAELDLSDGNNVFTWDDVHGSNRAWRVATSQVTVNEVTGTLKLGSGSNVADGDTITLSTPDGALTEVWRFKATPAQDYDVDIGASFTLTLSNLYYCLRGEATTSGIHGWPGTPPSAFVYTNSVDAGDTTSDLHCRPQRDVVLVSITSGTLVVKVGTLNSALTGRIYRGQTITPTAPTFKLNGMSGRPTVYFDGVANKLETLVNASKSPTSADEQSTVFPGYGIRTNPSSSARFTFFIVAKPYTQYAPACMIGQQVQGSNAWTRRIVSNRGASGLYDEGKLGVVENDGGTLKTHAAQTDGDGVAAFSMVSLSSNPTGNYEVYYNGAPMLNAGATHTGTAVANDSLARTFLGQSPGGSQGEGHFWEGEIGMILAVHSPDSAPMSLDERQVWEGALAWYFGAQGKLPATHPYYSTPPAPPDGSVNDFHLARRALTTTPAVTVLDAKSHDVAWIAASEPGGDSVGGLGYGLAWDSAGALYSVGAPADHADDPTDVRKIIDKGDDYSLDTADGAWAYTFGTSATGSFSYDKLELAVDQWNNLFVPFQADGYGFAPLQFLMFDDTGALLLSPPAPQAQAAFSIAVNLPVPEYGEGSTIERPELVTLALRRESAATLTMANNPSDGDSVTFQGFVGGVPVAETYTFKATLSAAGHILIGATGPDTLANLTAAVNQAAGSGTTYHASTVRSQLVSMISSTSIAASVYARQYGGDITALSSTAAAVFVPASPDPFTVATGNARQMRLVDTSSLAGSGRVRRRIAVVGSDIVRFDETDKQAVTGGVGVIDSTSRYIHSVTLFRWTFTTDGQRSWVYDSRTDKVAEFVATKGIVPKRVQIWEAWRARLVGLNSADNPARHFEAAAGDPFDWDYQPAVQVPGQAWNSGLPPSFDIPDVLNGWIPMDDDNAIIIGDSTLWWQTGDVAINGQADQITRGVGGAFGRAWCLGPQGEAYLWSSQNEILAVNRNGVRTVTGKRIARVLESVDLTQFFIRMAWDHRQNALLVMACPYGGVSAANRVFQWEPEVDAWWELEFAAAGHRVGDLVVINGDALDDRHVLFTQADGYGRTWDGDADDDDGEQIHAHVLIGPLAYRDARLQSQLSQLQVLLDGQSGNAYIEVWSSNSPSDKGARRYQGTIRPGMSPVHLPRASGNYLWLILRGTSKWAFEQASAIIEPSGVKRRI